MKKCGALHWFKTTQGVYIQHEWCVHTECFRQWDYTHTHTHTVSARKQTDTILHWATHDVKMQISCWVIPTSWNSRDAVLQSLSALRSSWHSPDITENQSWRTDSVTVCEHPELCHSTTELCETQQTAGLRDQSEKLMCCLHSMET